MSEQSCPICKAVISGPEQKGVDQAIKRHAELKHHRKVILFPRKSSAKASR